MTVYDELVKATNTIGSYKKNLTKENQDAHNTIPDIQ